MRARVTKSNLFVICLLIQFRRAGEAHKVSRKSEVTRLWTESIQTREKDRARRNLWNDRMNIWTNIDSGHSISIWIIGKWSCFRSIAIIHMSRHHVLPTRPSSERDWPLGVTFNVFPRKRRKGSLRTWPDVHQNLVVRALSEGKLLLSGYACHFQDNMSMHRKTRKLKR